jgi:soluble lytic murein transglycosylase-like protein
MRIRWHVVALIGCVALGAGAQEHPQAGRYKRDLIRQARLVWGLNAPVATFAAQVHQESSFNAQARSHAGAQGLAQFMPATAKWIGEVYPELEGADVFNPTWAFRALAQYMRHLFDRVTAVSDCERMAFTLSAYNGGERRVKQRKALSQNPEVCMGHTCEINPGISPGNQRENSHYPKRILLELEPRYLAWGRGSCGRDQSVLG